MHERDRQTAGQTDGQTPGDSKDRAYGKNSNLLQLLCRDAKFVEDRTIRGRVFAYFRFSKWRPSYDVTADHPRLVFDGSKILLKLHVDRSYLYFARYRDFNIRPVWLAHVYSRLA